MSSTLHHIFYLHPLHIYHFPLVEPVADTIRIIKVFRGFLSTSVGYSKESARLFGFMELIDLVAYAFKKRVLLGCSISVAAQSKGDLTNLPMCESMVNSCSLGTEPSEVKLNDCGRRFNALVVTVTLAIVCVRAASTPSKLFILKERE